MIRTHPPLPNLSVAGQPHPLGLNEILNQSGVKSFALHCIALRTLVNIF